MYLLIAQESVIIDIQSGVETKRKFNISTISESIQYIPLEMTEYNLISYIDKIKITADFIFIRTFNPVAIYRFDRMGKFLNKIGTQGRGPNEYSFMAGFGINEQNQEVYLYALLPSRIFVYSFNGIFKKKLDWPVNENPNNFTDSANDIEFISNENFLVMYSNGQGNIPFSYKIFSKNNDCIKKAIQPLQFSMKGTFGSAHEFSYFNFNNNLYIKENLLNDTLYKVSPELEFLPQYIFKAGKYTCPVKFRQEFMSFMERKDLKYFQPRNIFECNYYVIFFYVFNMKEYFGFYDKKSKETFTTENKGIFNDYDGGIDFKALYQENYELIGYINAIDLISHVNSTTFRNSTPKYPEKKKELEKLANSLNENDNPVLMLVKLKK